MRNPFLSLEHCKSFAQRAVRFEDDSLNVVVSRIPGVPLRVLPGRELATASDRLDHREILFSVDPFMDGIDPTK